MDFISRTEITLAEWYRSAPHLPPNGRKWLASNIWWMALVGAVLSILGTVVLIPATITAMILVSYGSLVPYGHPGPSLAPTWGVWFSMMLSIVDTIAAAVLLTMSVNPLKAKSRRGWKLIFVLYVFGIALNIIDAVVLLSIWSLINAAVFAAIGGYLLFEIRGYFGGSAKVKVAKTSKPAKKPAKKSK